MAKSVPDRHDRLSANNGGAKGIDRPGRSVFSERRACPPGRYTFTCASSPLGKDLRLESAPGGDDNCPHDGHPVCCRCCCLCCYACRIRLSVACRSPRCWFYCSPRLPHQLLNSLQSQQGDWRRQGCHQVSLPQIAVVGRPNVGKSTIANRLTKEFARGSLVFNQPGVHEIAPMVRASGMAASSPLSILVASFLTMTRTTSFCQIRTL